MLITMVRAYRCPSVTDHSPETTPGNITVRMRAVLIAYVRFGWDGSISKTRLVAKPIKA